MSKNIETMMEDYALEAVPQEMRRPWHEIASIQVGVVTALAMILIGGLVTFMAGLWLGMLASFIALIVSTIYAFLLGTISYREGLASNPISRAYAFGNRGSALSSLIMMFIIIGFLGIESVLIGKSLIFFFGIQETLTLKIILYVLLAIIWTLFSLFGMKVVARVAQITIPILLIFLLYMIYLLVSNGNFSEFITHGAMVPGITPGKGFSIALNTTLTMAGLFAIVVADTTRFAKSRQDVLKVSLTAGIAEYIVMIFIGAIITYFGFSNTVEYFIKQGLDQTAAGTNAISNPGITLVLSGGFVGLLVIFFSQLKVQVINSYEGALTLVNFFDSAFNWKPGRPTMVIIANIISLIFIFGNILHYTEEFFTLGSVLMGVWVIIVLTDYYICRGIMKRGTRGIENLESLPAFNWNGICTLIVSTVIGMIGHQMGWFPIPFIISTLLAFFMYLTISYFQKPSTTLESKKNEVPVN